MKMCMEWEKNSFGNVRPAVHTRPLERTTQAVVKVGLSNVPRFGHNHEGIGVWEMRREVAYEDVVWMENICSRNVRPTVYTGPLERPTQIASHVRPSHAHIVCL